MLNKERPEVIETIIDYFSGEFTGECLDVKIGFYGKFYEHEFKEWMNAEYVEPFKITQAEKSILESIDKEYLWIVRDLSEGIGLYTAKPEKEGKGYHLSMGSYTDMRLFKHLFNWLTVQNSPLKISDILENCEVINNVK